MLAPMGSEGSVTWRIGDFEFRPATGELQHLSPSDGSRCIRLQPQPSQLLDLLARRSGELVTREEIRELLWGDTHVDVEQSLTFCVRQIRAALGDSARQPTYVETLPRRGYRLLAPAVPLTAATPPPERTGLPPQPSARRRRRLVLATAAPLVVAIALGWVVAANRPDDRPLRLAIMPFELAAQDASIGLDLATVSESLVVELAHEDGLEVIGPRSTAAYSRFPFPELRRLADELEVDYVINARLLEGDSRPQLIVELIRLSDGAHPWVERFSPPWSSTTLAASVRSGVTTTLAGKRR